MRQNTLAITLGSNFFDIRKEFIGLVSEDGMYDVQVSNEKAQLLFKVIDEGIKLFWTVPPFNGFYSGYSLKRVELEIQLVNPERGHYTFKFIEEKLD